MSRHPRAFEIRYYDNLLRQCVHSEFESRWYLCDLDELGGNGWCSCQRFEFEYEPQVERFISRCKHIKAFRRHLAKLFCPDDIKFGFAILNEIIQRRKGKV